MEKTEIYKRTTHDNEYRDELLGYLTTELTTEGKIYRGRGGQGLDSGQLIGRVDEQGRVYQKTTHDERELGYFTADGHVRSHGLFEGGDLGWVDADGVVVQGGLILGEEEVGRVEGPQQAAAAAALLLIFIPEEAEQNRRVLRQG